MDRQTWVTDKFYLQFPSYSEQSRKRELLAKSRQQEYQKFLKQLTFIDDSKSTRSVKRITNSKERLKRAKVPDLVFPLEIDSGRTSELSNMTTGISKHSDIEDANLKTKLLSGLKSMDIPDILDEEVIQQRNRRITEEKDRRKIQYQHDLLAQIEQKRQENEKVKAKEKEEEERLTRKMEEQLRAVRLQMEKERERENCERDRRLQAVEKVKPKKQEEITKYTKNIKETYQSTHEQRKAYSESDKENFISKKTDRDLYKYFSNSAKDSNDLENMRYRAFSPDVIENVVAPSAFPQTNSIDDFCLDCQFNIQKSVCSFCQQQRFLSRNRSKNTMDHNLFLCTLCHSDPVCSSCQKKVCQKCKKPLRKDRKNRDSSEFPKSAYKTETDLRNPSTSPRKNDRPSDLTGSKGSSKVFESEVLQHANSISQTTYLKGSDVDDNDSNFSSARKLYSINLEKSSVFHPDNRAPKKRFSINIKNGEIVVERDGFDTLDELKRITDEKISKFIKCYGELPPLKPLKKKSIDIDEIPIPLYAEQLRSAIDSRRESIEAFKMLETKWDIPVVQKNITIRENDNNVCVLTQVGAFKKQLQLDQFEIDDFNTDKLNH